VQPGLEQQSFGQPIMAYLSIPAKILLPNGEYHPLVAIHDDPYNRLRPLETQHAFLPIGWGEHRKAPVLKGWPKHPGFPMSELKDFPGSIATGVRTEGLVCFDFDGKSAVEYAIRNGRNPNSVITWNVHRDTDDWRFKILFKPSPEQIKQLPNGMYSGKEATRPAEKDEDGKIIRKGEAEEIFIHPGRQVIIHGEHWESGGQYYWPPGLGPEALAPPPENWWQAVIEKASSQKPNYNHQGTRKSLGTDWTRLEQCPICGRDERTVCQQHQDGNTLRCFVGSTFRPPENLKPGERVPGTEWHYSSKQDVEWGEFEVFTKFAPSPLKALRRSLRNG
jgi:hypothetical protein